MDTMDSSMNPTARICPACLQPLPADAPQGLCPQCLAKSALGSQPGADETVASGSKPGGSGPAAIQTEIARLFPQLEILELLGQGGMGMVYKARQPQLDRLVALKVMRADLSRDPAFAERFAREARALAKLNHPNIVSVFDFGETGGHCWFLMEFVDGTNLRQLLRAKTLTAREALGIVPKVCDALQFAHDEGIVHRDIKPENILLDKKGRVKIADFGLAKLVGKDATEFHLTATGMTLGTPRYMAPEQFDKPQEVDHRADIYSLGVVLYEMLTGEVPMGRFAPPSATIGVDVRLDEVVLRSLEKEPSRRYQHASDVKTQVENISGVMSGLPPTMRSAFGFDYKSKTQLWGMPLVHICNGMDPTTGRVRTAKGIIAIGDKAKGVIALGGAATGVFAFGGVALGVFALGGTAIGLFSFGGLALALIFATGGLAAAPVVFGGLAAGYIAVGGLAVGAHTASGGGPADDVARRFYEQFPLWRIWIGAMILSMGSLPVSFGAMAWARRKVTRASSEEKPRTQSRNRLTRVLLWLVVIGIVSAIANAWREVRKYRAAEQWSEGINYTFAHMGDFERGPDGPQFSKSKIKQLGLTPEQAQAVNKLVPKSYAEFVALEQQHTQVTTNDRSHLLITISPFREETLALAKKLNDDVRNISGKDIIHFDWQGNLRAFGLFRHCGDTTVTAELWKEPARAWSSDPAGGTYHFEERHADNSRSRGGRGDNWKHVIPEEYWIYWNESPVGTAPATTPTKNANSELSAAEVLRKMQARYDSLTSFSGSGKVVSDINPNAGAMTNSIVSEHTFAMKLARPDFYRIEWTQDVGGFYTNTGAVWDAGGGPHLLMGTNSSRPLNRELALSLATGVSGGAAQQVPALFFEEKTLGWISGLTNLTRGPDEKVGDEDCYVVSADDRVGKEILWITKKNFLLKQIKSVLGSAGLPAEASQGISDLSDESMKKLMKSTGQQPTPEAMAKFRNQIAATAKKAGQLRGSITQTFQTLSPDEIMERDDFSSPLPVKVRPPAK